MSHVVMRKGWHEKHGICEVPQDLVDWTEQVSLGGQTTKSFFPLTISRTPCHVHTPFRVLPNLMMTCLGCVTFPKVKSLWKVEEIWWCFTSFISLGCGKRSSSCCKVGALSCTVYFLYVCASVPSPVDDVLHMSKSQSQIGLQTVWAQRSCPRLSPLSEELGVCSQSYRKLGFYNHRTLIC